MTKKMLWPLALASSLVIIACTFIFWPLLGHDYALIVPSLIDLKVAFSQHGILNPHFSPMKCLGTPLWANPVSFNLSILHFLTIISNDLIGIILFIGIVGISSFYGAYQLARFLGVNENWSLYLATGWTLQGWMILRSVVGHTTYLSLGWFPFILFLLLKKRSFVSDLLACLLAAFFLTQSVFLAAPYNPFFFGISCLAVFPILLVWKRIEFIEWKSLSWKLLFTAIISFLVLYPKLNAVRDLMMGYPRSEPLAKIGLAVLPYSIMNLFSFLPHDYKSLVEWWYGNWEAVQFLYPLFLILAFVVLLRGHRENDVVKLLVSVFYLIFVSLILCSGVLSETFQNLPVFNSMHVNPRWNIVTAIPVFFLVAFLLKSSNLFQRKGMLVLFLLAFVAPFIHLMPKNLSINYQYRNGYVPELNRLSYCYEPFMGYKLEYFPPQMAPVDFRTSPSIDPRCYLPSRQCSPGTLMDPEEMPLLETYRLQ